MAGRKKKGIPPGRDLDRSKPPKRPTPNKAGRKDTTDIRRRPAPASNLLPADPSNPPDGMPDSYSPARMASILESIAGGLSLQHTLRMLGLVGYFPSWRKSAKRFVDELVARADSKFISENLVKIRSASNRSWQAAAWLLERRFPSQFSQSRGTPSKGGITTGPVLIQIVSAVPRPDDIMRNRGRRVAERGKPPDEIEAENAEMLEIIDIAATEIRSNVPRRALPEGEENN